MVTIATSEWKGVSSAGVTASWDPEATEVSDDSPTLAQPVARAEKGAMFVPFSIEIGQDWTWLQQELGSFDVLSWGLPVPVEAYLHGPALTRAAG